VSAQSEISQRTSKSARPQAPRPDRTRIALEFLERAGLPLLTIAMFIFFAVDSESGSIFTSSANLDTILGNQAVTGLVALAMIVPLVSGYFDLSVSATTGVANIAMAALIGTHSWAIFPAILVVLAIGALIGAINGFLVARLGLNGFVVTLGTYTLLGGLVELYTKGQQITAGLPASFGDWGSKDWLGVPRPFVLLMLVAAGIWYLLRQTPFGRSLEAIGSNESAARLVGINVERKVWLSFVISGFVAAGAGILATSRAGIGNPELGNAYLFPALAAVFLGATTIRPGRYNAWGTMIGVYFVAISVSGFTLLGAEIWVQPVFNGASLVIAVALSTFFARQRERRASSNQLAEAELQGSPSALPGGDGRMTE
jgi:ribose transport system permease protein